MNELRKLIEQGEDYFGSGGHNTPEFNSFAVKFKVRFRKELDKIEATDFELNKGHFYLSGFFRVGEQLVYFSISDVRHGFDSNMLVRTAEHNKDWTGGHNQYVTIQNGMSSELESKFSQYV